MKVEQALVVFLPDGIGGQEIVDGGGFGGGAESVDIVPQALFDGLLCVHVCVFMVMPFVFLAKVLYFFAVVFFQFVF